MDTDSLFFVYYSTLLACVLIYVFFTLRYKFRLASASTFAFVYAFVLIGLPGFYVAAGTISDDIDRKFNEGFDTELCWLYLVFMVIVTIGLLSGQIAGKRLFVRTKLRTDSDIKLKIFLFMFCIYLLAYLLWLPYNPLNNLLFSRSFSFAEIVKQRIAITHGLGQEEGLPFVFRYWRNIADYILPVLFYYYCITYKVNKRSLLLLLFLFLYVLYLQLFTLEKGPFFKFLLGMLALYYLRKQRTLRPHNTPKYPFFIKYSAGFLTIFLCLAFVYKLFMNVEDGLWARLFSRVFSQSASNYVQIEYVRQIGFLGFSGFKMPILSHLLDIEFVDPSKHAISLIYPQYVVGETMGAAGGMSLTNLYFIMGWYSVAVFYFFVFLFGFIDKFMINSIYNPINRDGFFLNISFYSIFIMNFSIAISAQIWIGVAIPTILSPPLIILTTLYIIFIKLPDRILRIQNQHPMSGCKRVSEAAN
jgi:hypothetical protein